MRPLLFLLLTSCAFQPSQDPRTIVGVDPAAAPYVASFESALGSSIGDIPVALTTDIQSAPGVTSSDVVGVCEAWITSSGTYKEVLLDYDFFTNSNDAGRTALVWHELGHCVLNRAHNLEATNSSSCVPAQSLPMSWMYPYVFFTEDAYVTAPADSCMEPYYEGEMFTTSDWIPWLTDDMVIARAAGDPDWVVHDIR